MNLTDLDTFLRVVSGGSYTAAAAQLGVPKSTVSRRVARLEDALGIELLSRKARSITVTPFGRQLHARAAPAIHEIHEVERTLQDATGEPSGTLRVTATSDLGSSSVFGRLLESYCERYPRVRTHVELTSRRIDLIDEGYDVAFRAHSGPLADATGLLSKRMIKAVGACFASPAYIDVAGAPRTPEELIQHPCLTLAVPGLGDSWPLGRNGDQQTFDIDVRISANDFSLLISAALAHAGIAYLPTFLARPHVERGDLIRVLPQWSSPGGLFTLIWPASRHLAPRVRAFIDLATELFHAPEANPT